MKNTTTNQEQPTNQWEPQPPTFNYKKWLIIAVLALLSLAYVGLVDNTHRNEIRVFLRQLARAL